MSDLAKRIASASNKHYYIKRSSITLSTTLADLERDCESAIEVQDATEKAGMVIKAVAQNIQSVLEANIADLVNKAIHEVFVDESFDFKMQYTIKNGKVEVEFMYVTEDGNELSPLEDSGIGTVDVVAFALRVSLWFLSRKKVRPVILLDEPFKNISANFRPIFLKLVQVIAKETGIQLIIVTHHEDIISIADNVIRVTKHGTKNPSSVQCEVV